jgi:hypothetical protein
MCTHWLKCTCHNTFQSGTEIKSLSSLTIEFLSSKQGEIELTVRLHENNMHIAPSYAKEVKMKLSP